MIKKIGILLPQNSKIKNINCGLSTFFLISKNSSEMNNNLWTWSPSNIKISLHSFYYIFVWLLNTCYAFHFNKHFFLYNIIKLSLTPWVWATESNSMQYFLIFKFNYFFNKIDKPRSQSREVNIIHSHLGTWGSGYKSKPKLGTCYHHIAIGRI